MFSGSLVALATPFDEDNRIDYKALERLIEFHVQEGTDGLVIAGTTGESATLEKGEHAELIGRAAEIVDGRLPVIAGTGSNSTAQTIALSEEVARYQIDGYLMVVPYYNKPVQEGLYRHFWAAADAVQKPVMLYNPLFICSAQGTAKGRTFPIRVFQTKTGAISRPFRFFNRNVSLITHHWSLLLTPAIRT